MLMSLAVQYRSFTMAVTMKRHLNADAHAYAETAFDTAFLAMTWQAVATACRDKEGMDLLRSKFTGRLCTVIRTTESSPDLKSPGAESKTPHHYK